MTLKNPDLHRVYDAAREGKLGDDIQRCAEAADAAYEAVRESLEGHRMQCPNTDGAENMITAVFEEMLIENGYQWGDLVAAADRFQ